MALGTGSLRTVQGTAREFLSEAVSFGMFPSVKGKQSVRSLDFIMYRPGKQTCGIKVCGIEGNENHKV